MVTLSLDAVAFLQNPANQGLLTPPQVVQILSIDVFESGCSLEGNSVQAKATIEDGSEKQMDVYLRTGLNISSFHTGDISDNELSDGDIVKLKLISRPTPGDTRCARALSFPQKMVAARFT